MRKRKLKLQPIGHVTFRDKAADESNVLTVYSDEGVVSLGIITERYGDLALLLPVDTARELAHMLDRAVEAASPAP